ncbi:MAG: hypothetical protein AAF578_10315 [Pseudomonadota bacterium]
MKRLFGSLAVVALLLSTTNLLADRAELEEALSVYKSQVRSGDAEKILAASEQVLASAREALQPPDEDLVTILSDHAVALEAVGDAPNAQTIFDEAIQTADAVHGAVSTQHLDLYLARAESLHDAFKPKPAERSYRTAVEVAETVYGDNSADYADVLVYAARELHDHCNSSVGRPWLYRALDILDAVEQPTDTHRPLKAMASFYLGKIASALGDESVAIKYFDQTLKLSDDSTKIGTTIILGSHMLLARLYENVGDVERAQFHETTGLALGGIPGVDDPTPIFRTPPRYPQYMARRYLVGYVEFEFSIDEDGNVVQIEPIEVAIKKNFPDAEYSIRETADTFDSSTFRRAARDLVETSSKTLSQWRYAPRYQDGVAVVAEGLRTKLTFELATR